MINTSIIAGKLTDAQLNILDAYNYVDKAAVQAVGSSADASAPSVAAPAPQTVAPSKTGSKVRINLLIPKDDESLLVTGLLRDTTKDVEKRSLSSMIKESEVLRNIMQPFFDNNQLLTNDPTFLLGAIEKACPGIDMNELKSKMVPYQDYFEGKFDEWLAAIVPSNVPILDCDQLPGYACESTTLVFEDDNKTHNLIRAFLAITDICVKFHLTYLTDDNEAGGKDFEKHFKFEDCVDGDTPLDNFIYWVSDLKLKAEFSDADCDLLEKATIPDMGYIKLRDKADYSGKVAYTISLGASLFVKTYRSDRNQTRVMCSGYEFKDVMNYEYDVPISRETALPIEFLDKDGNKLVISDDPELTNILMI